MNHPIKEALWAVGRKISLLTVRNLQKSQAQEAQLSAMTIMGVRGVRWDKRDTVEKKHRWTITD